MRSRRRQSWSKGFLHNALVERLQFLTGLEANRFPGRNRDFGARARITADSRLTRADVEDPKAAELYALTLGEGALHRFENRFHGHLRLSLGDSRAVDHFVHDIELDQDVLPVPRRQVQDYRKAHDMIRVLGLSSDPLLRTVEAVSIWDYEAYRKACGSFATGITVVTTRGLDGLPYGFTANSFTSVSWDPPIVSVALHSKANVYPQFAAARRFAINILSVGQELVSAQFARGAVSERFEGIDWEWSGRDLPLISGGLAHFECSTLDTVEVGDHIVMLGQVEHFASRDGYPLVFFRSAYRRLAE